MSMVYRRAVRLCIVGDKISYPYNIIKKGSRDFISNRLTGLSQEGTIVRYIEFSKYFAEPSAAGNRE